MSSWPALKEVRSFLRLQPDADQDAVIQTALAAATAAGIKRMGFVITVVDNGNGTMTRTYTPRTRPTRPTCPTPHTRRASFTPAGCTGGVTPSTGRSDSGIWAWSGSAGSTPTSRSLYALDAPLVFG